MAKVKQFTFSIGKQMYVVAAATEKSARSKAARLFKAQVNIREKK